MPVHPDLHHPLIRIAAISCVCFGLVACGAFYDLDRLEPTLADLERIEPPARSTELAEVGLQQVIDSYRTLLATTDDPEIREQAMVRLGNLLLLDSEERQLDQGENEQQVLNRYHDEVVDYYKKLLLQYPDNESNDAVYYQLAKAYDLDTRREESAAALERLVRKFPDSPYAAEAHFRIGETLFSDGKYREAQDEYDKTIEFGESTAYYENALYMKGWTEFKRSRYEDSLVAFWQAMDRVWPEEASLKSLPSGKQELITDTLRVMSLSFSYLEGPESIAVLTQQAGIMHYEPLLYSNLAELYLSQKRYKDTADTYQAYIDGYPTSDEAPAYHVRQIDAYMQGDFPTLILPAKKQYVENYGIKSDYWKAKDTAVHDTLKPKLFEYLDELARISHADAQEMKQLWQNNQGKPRQLAKLKFAEKDIYAEYREAGRWYEQYIQTFPDAKKTNEFWFLLAESQYEARDYSDAIGSYQRIAYDIDEHPKAAEAGYAALLTFDKQLQSLGTAESSAMAAADRERWDRSRIDSSLRFADRFESDKRAPVVLVKAAEDLLGREEYEAAVNAGRKVVQWPLPTDKQTKTNAWLVVAHGEFEQDNYAAAEQGYAELNRLLPANDARRKDINENLAASVYKQAEQTLADGNTRAAVDQFMRVAKVAPGTAIAVNAEFDAATHLLGLKAWPEAIDVLTDLRARHPNHELSAEIPDKLLLAYQETEQWGPAASELDTIAQADDDPERARNASYRSAELYQKAGDIRRAANVFTRYVASYPEPFEQNLEALYQLSEIQDELGNRSAYEQSLQKMVTLERSPLAADSERARYLAANGTLYFADQERARFDAIKLSLPLKNSLARKKTALQSALDQYNRAVGYEVQEFATRATFNIGEIYAGLSSDLMASSRPSGMNELELEQYEVLLEEQAFPFEEDAIEIHETNAKRSWVGIYDDWVQRSLDSLATLMPGRYGKQELRKGYEDAIQ